MDSGVASLLGALVGGGASLAGAAYAQSAQSRRETARRQAEANDRALIAARIVQGDLAWAEARIAQAMSIGKYWSRRYALREESWLAYREALAVSLDSAADWVVVHDAFRSIRTLELQAGRGRSDNPLSRPRVGDFDAQRLAAGLEDIRRAIAVLEPIAGRIEEASTEEQEPASADR